jgi:hypothetical protein
MLIMAATKMGIMAASMCDSLWGWLNNLNQLSPCVIGFLLNQFEAYQLAWMAKGTKTPLPSTSLLIASPP